MSERAPERRPTLAMVAGWAVLLVIVTPAACAGWAHVSGGLPSRYGDGLAGGVAYALWNVPIGLALALSLLGRSYRVGFPAQLSMFLVFGCAALVVCAVLLDDGPTMAAAGHYGVGLAISMAPLVLLNLFPRPRSDTPPRPETGAHTDRPTVL